MLLTDSMQAYAWTYPLPYITISYATGQWFETAMWEEYHAGKEDDAPDLTRVLMSTSPGSPPLVFFSEGRGGTWQNWDNRMFSWIGDNLAVSGLIAVASIAVLVALVVGIVRCARLTRSKPAYKQVPQGPQA